jgi:hypothetical protein
MNIVLASGFAKEAKQASVKSWVGAGLGALGTGLGAGALVQGQRTRTDMGAMRGRNRAADALHSAMLFEARTGQKIPAEMRTRIGTDYMKANQAYRARFPAELNPKSGK